MLSELAYLIKSTIQSSINDEYWVIAEIAQINCHYNSGHCYLDLVEKRDDVTTAKMRATIWASLFRQIGSNFRALTGQDLQTGMNILMLARVTYHEVHGLSLNIRDIDPRYTLGEMALKRKRIIEQLSKEGIMDKNRQLSLPPVIQNIAVISSATAAGYGDIEQAGQ
jgi:exodeoxyribonuclease VII large subunit